MQRLAIFTLAALFEEQHGQVNVRHQVDINGLLHLCKAKIFQLLAPDNCRVIDEYVNALEFLDDLVPDSLDFFLFAKVRLDRGDVAFHLVEDVELS